MRQVSDHQRFNALLSEYHFHLLKYRRGIYGTAVTPYHLAGTFLTLRLLHHDLMKLNPRRCILEVPELPEGY